MARRFFETPPSGETDWLILHGGALHDDDFFAIVRDAGWMTFKRLLCRRGEEIIKKRTDTQGEKLKPSSLGRIQ